MENICNIGGNSGQKQIGEFISGPRINIRHARASYRAHAPRFTASIFRRVNVNFCASKWPRPPIFDAHI